MKNLPTALLFLIRPLKIVLEDKEANPKIIFWHSQRGIADSSSLLVALLLASDLDREEMGHPIFSLIVRQTNRQTNKKVVEVDEF